MRVFRRGVPAVFVILLSVLFLKGSTINVPTGTWQPASNMSVARANAIAVLVPDGRIVLAGGADATGAPIATAEAFSADGTFSALPAMSVARAQHAAIYTMTGDLLVTGGRTSGGGITNSAEIFDSLTNTWHSLSANMVEPRAGHTLSQLQNGNVLIAGGENSSGPVAALEIYDITSGQFSFAGTLSTARKGHAAAVLNDGRVLIIGGTTIQSDGTSATLASTEIYDPSTGQVTAGPSLATPRTNATATTLLDGRVLVLGGSYPEGANGAAPELASTEIFDPVSNTFTASASHLTTARSGHLAFLLPNNNNVLIVGGTATQPDRTVSPLASAELYTPWTDTFAPTQSMSTVRDAGTGSALNNTYGFGTDGLLLMAGGTNVNSAEVYGFATVKTDKSDYAPGEVVTITGTGWKPGETVTLSLVESPSIDTPPTITAVADANGNISDSSFSPDVNDYQIRFTLTASGSTTVQTSFMDAGSDTFDSSPQNFNISLNPGQAIPSGITVTYNVTSKGTNHVTFPVTGTLALQNPAPFGTLSKGTFSISSYTVGDSVTLTGQVPCTQAAGQVKLQIRASTTATNLNPNQTNTPVNITVTGTPDPSCDSIPPTTTATANGGAYTSASWTDQNVSIALSATDNVGGSGVKQITYSATGAQVISSTTVTGSSANVPTITTEGTTTVSYHATDNANNVEITKTFTVKIDKTLPTVNITPSRSTPDSNGWYNKSLDFTVSGNDGTGSGIASCTTIPTYSGPDSATASVNASCTDNAGNTGSNTFTFKYESTALTVTATPDRPADHNGWYNHAVGVSFSATGSLAGTVTCDLLKNYSGPDTATASVTGNCSDAAGVSGTGTYNFKYDATAPILAGVRTTAANGNGWNNTAVSVRFTCTDATSQLESIMTNGAASGTSSISPLDVTVAGEGENQTVTGTCTDQAGNAADSVNVSQINIDETKPAITGSRLPLANSYGWNNVDVAVSFTCSDVGSVQSGLLGTYTDGHTLTAEGANQSVTSTVACTDKAGNTADPASVNNINIDKTEPTLTWGAQAPAANVNGWNNTSVSVPFTANDSLSGVDPASPAGPLSFTTEGTGLTQTVTITDKAGNSKTFTSPAINIDETKPAITGSRLPLANSYGWNNVDVAVSFTCSDVGSVQSGLLGTYTDGHTLTAEGANQSVTSTVACTDKAGNTADPASVSNISIDKTAPTISAALPAPASTGWYNITTGAPDIKFTCGDSLSGVVSCPGDLIPSDGANQSFTKQITDKAGNQASWSQSGINVDTVAPSITINSPNPVNYVLNQPVAASYSCSDGTSGVASCSGPVPSGSNMNTGSVGPMTFTVNATDVAGNPAASHVDYSVLYQSAGMCNIGPGHVILQPINVDGTSIYPRKQGSTIPVKFRVCDAYGNSVGPTSVMANNMGLVMTAVWAGTTPVGTVEDILSTTPDTTFRWDGQEWIFNMSTKNLASGYTYDYKIVLLDGTYITFRIGLK